MFFAFIFLILMLASFISIFVGMINPAAFTRFFKRNLGRKNTSLIFTGLTLLFFIIFGVVAPNSPSDSRSANTQPTQEKKTEAKQVAPSTKPQTAKTNITPEPTNPCKEYIGSIGNQYRDCMDLWVKDQNRNEPVLKADVEATNQSLVVTNQDTVDWTGCDYSIGANTNPDNFYELGGLFGGPYATIKAGQTISVPWGELTLNDGTRFDYSAKKPDDLHIECSVGDESEQWGNY